MSFTVRSWGTATPLPGEELRKHNVVVTYHQNVYSGEKERGKERQRDRKQLRKKKRYLTSLLNCLAVAVHRKLTKYQNLPRGQKYEMTIVSCYVLL